VNKTRIVVVVAVVVCVALSLSLVYQNIHYTGIVAGKDKDIADLHGIESSLTKERDELRSDIVDLNGSLQTYYSLTREQAERITELEKYADELRDTIVGGDDVALKTIVFHWSEKGPTSNFGRSFNMSYVYDQLMNFSKYPMLFLPEYEGNKNWTETYAWLLENFADKPIVLSTWEGGDSNEPIVMRGITQISQAYQTLDVRMLRIAEPLSYYMYWNQTFPEGYFREVLSYAKSQNLKVLWSEWKRGQDVYPNVTEIIKGFEDTVIFTYQTNDQYSEPVDGYLEAASTFEHWGASVQAWYWETHGKGQLMDMSPILMVQHALQAINCGAEVIQFEPYWYFFDNYGEPYPIVDLLKTVF
jgi:hypothetical protein